MTDQPPVQPPHQPPRQPSGHATEGNPATQSMPAAAGAPVVPGPPPPKPNVWSQATSTTGGRWALGVAAGALVVLMLVCVGVAGLLVLRSHDRVAMVGQRQDGFSRDQGDQGGKGNDREPGARDRDNLRQPGMPGVPGMPGGRAQGQGGLGSLLGGSAVHGTVTATVNGSVQALAFQHGEVTALSATSITLKSSDGFVGTYGRTAATKSRGAAPVKGGQVFVLARASDKVAITIVATPANGDVAPSN